MDQNLGAQLRGATQASPRTTSIAEDMNQRLSSVAMDIEIMVNVVERLTISFGRPADHPSVTKEVEGKPTNTLDLVTLIESRLQSLRQTLRRLDPNV